MRVTEKGQVTIPKSVRDRLGIVPGSEVAFVERNGGIEIVKTQPPEDRERFKKQFEAEIERMRGTLDTHGMGGKAYVDWMRGPREDLDDA
jgi:AbrB family looped-hinge helix DNA binding protein